MVKGMLIGSSVGLLVFIISLSLSTYGLGREEDDKAGTGYQVASAFTGISTVGIIITMLVLIVAILQVPNLAEKTRSFNFSPRR